MSIGRRGDFRGLAAMAEPTAQELFEVVISLVPDLVSVCEKKHPSIHNSKKPNQRTPLLGTFHPRRSGRGCKAHPTGHHFSSTQRSPGSPSMLLAFFSRW